MSDFQDSDTSSNIRTDGALMSLLYNSKTGMGGSRDPSSYTVLNLPGILQESELRTLYQSSWFFPRVVDTISTDATKQDWLNIKIVDGNEGDVQKVEKKLKAIAFREAVRKADQLARLFGGSAIFIGANKNKDVDKPLSEESVRSIEYLRVLDRYQIRPALGENVLNPEYYQISISSRDGIEDSKGQEIGFEQRIHKSRVIRFYGNPLPPIDLSQNEGWGLSVIQGIYEPFKRYYEGGQILGQILRTMSTLNLSMSNLGELIAAGKSDDVKAHYKEVSMMASVFNTLLTDSSLENASYLSRSMAGAPEAIEKFKEELTAASNYPYYKIWGEVGKAGLSDTGGAESEAYAQHVSQYQDDHYAPGVEFFLPLVMKVELGKVPDDWEVSFNSIYKLSQAAQIENDSKVANTNKVLFDAGAIKTEEWRRSVSSGQPIANVIEISAGEADNKEEAIPQVYNGAQITAVVDIVKAIAGGEIPRDTGVSIVAKALAVPLKEAEEIVGSAGKQADGSQAPIGFNPNEFQGGLEDSATTDTPPTDTAAPETPPASDTPSQDGATDAQANPAEQASTTGEQLSVDTEDDYDRLVRWDAAEGEWVFLHEEMRSDAKRKCTEGIACGDSCVSSKKTCASKNGLSESSKSRVKDVTKRLAPVQGGASGTAKKSQGDIDSQIEDIRNRMDPLQEEYDRLFEKSPKEAFASDASKQLDELYAQLQSLRKEKARQAEVKAAEEAQQQRKKAEKQRDKDAQNLYKSFLKDGQEFAGKSLVNDLKGQRETPQLKKLKAELAELDKEFSPIFAEYFDRDENNVKGAYETEIGKKYSAVSKKIRKIENDQRDAQARGFEALRSKLLAESGMSREDAEAMASEVKILKSATREIPEEKIRSELADIYQMTGGKGSESLQKITRTDSRAYASEDGVLNVGKSEFPDDYEDKQTTFWHEMAHHMEFEDPSTASAMRAWIKSRADGPPQSMKELTGNSNFDDDEIAYPDKFIHPYVGKDYEDGSTEVLSMGFQHFTNSKDMLNLYRRDPEHFWLVVGAIRRKNNA